MGARNFLRLFIEKTGFYDLRSKGGGHGGAGLECNSYVSCAGDVRIDWSPDYDANENCMQLRSLL